jgi:hypothetical protein
MLPFSICCCYFGCCLHLQYQNSSFYQYGHLQIPDGIFCLLSDLLVVFLRFSVHVADMICHLLPPTPPTVVYSLELVIYMNPGVYTAYFLSSS